MAYQTRIAYSKDRLEKAVSAVRRKELSLRMASRQFGVPVTTLYDNAKVTERAPVGRSTDLSTEDEAALVGFCLYMANQGIPASRMVLRQKVIEIMHTYDHKTRINSETGPTNKWIRAFLQRHPELPERLAENMDAARASMSTTEVIDEYFSFMQAVLVENGLMNKPEQIFNCDETGWTGKEKSGVRFLGPKKGHVFRKKTSGGGHITAQLCVSASGRFLPSLVIFPGSIPHRPLEGVPESWMFSSSETGYINGDIFHQWLLKIFIPHCGKERPVLLVLDNHDSHVSIKTIQTAMENNIVLLGLPGHTTHILQPLDVKIFGPLKTRVANIMANIGYVQAGLNVGNHKFPAILRHAIDQTTPASVQRAFEVTGISPFNKHAIDRSQLIEPVFTSKQAENGIVQREAETCPTCGTYSVNPLVSRGVVPERLAKILAPPPVKPVPEEKTKISKKRVEKGRVLSTREMLEELQEKERQEECKRAAVEQRKKDAKERRLERQRQAVEKKQKREEEKAARVEKRKKEEEEKAERKRAREEKRQISNRKLKRGVEGELAALTAYAYVCSVCSVHGSVHDEENGMIWYGCDECDRWFHNSCLAADELERVVTSLDERCEWLCKVCCPSPYEE